MHVSLYACNTIMRIIVVAANNIQNTSLADVKHTNIQLFQETMVNLCYHDSNHSLLYNHIQNLKYYNYKYLCQSQNLICWSIIFLF